MITLPVLIRFRLFLCRPRLVLLKKRRRQPQPSLQVQQKRQRRQPQPSLQVQQKRQRRQRRLNIPVQQRIKRLPRHVVLIWAQICALHMLNHSTAQTTIISVECLLQRCAENRVICANNSIFLIRHANKAYLQTLF